MDEKLFSSVFGKKYCFHALSGISTVSIRLKLWGGMGLFKGNFQYTGIKSVLGRHSVVSHCIGTIKIFVHLQALRPVVTDHVEPHCDGFASHWDRIISHFGGHLNAGHRIFTTQYTSAHSIVDKFDHNVIQIHHSVYKYTKILIAQSQCDTTTGKITLEIFTTIG